MRWQGGFLTAPLTGLFLALSLAGRLQAAWIVWSPPVNVSGDTDVSTAGTLAYAYDWSGTNATVNGVAFTGTASTGGGGGNVGLAGLAGNTGGAYASSASPFAALSPAYKTVLGGGDYASSGSTAVTVTLNNLVSGNVYSVQVWVNDSRGGYNSRTETVATTGGNTVTLDYSTAAGSTAGGTGQHTVGRFQADSTVQTFTLLGAASTQLNALQVRNITGMAGALAYASWVNVAAGTTLQLTNNGLLTNVAALMVAAGGKVAVSNGVNQTVQSLCLGGQWEPDGSWGSSASGAANQNNTFFTGPGIVTVAHGTLAPPSARTPLFSFYGVRELARGGNPNSNSISYLPMPGHDYLPLSGQVLQSFDYNYSNGLANAAFYINDTAPLADNTALYGTYQKSNAVADTLNWFATNTSPVNSLGYVFSDFEQWSGYAGSLAACEQQVEAEAALANAAGVSVGNYATYPGTLTGNLGAAQNGPDSFYRSSGVNVAQPNAYAYSGYSNNGPNGRAGNFWSCLTLISIAKQALPAGHQLIPWAELSLAAGAVNGNTYNTWGDSMALYAQLRMRGVDGWGTQDPNIWWFAWTDLDWLFHSDGPAQILNLGSDETSGFQWSGYRAGGNVGFVFSNLGGSDTNFAKLPAIPGVPASVPVPAGADLNWYFVNDPAGLATNQIILGRDGVTYGLFANDTVTVTNSILVVAPGTNDDAGGVTIGSNLANGFTPMFAGPLILSNDVTLQGAAGNTVFSGVISGNSGIVSTGLVTLSGANTYAGGTTIPSGAGELVITSGRALGTGSVTVGKAGTASGTLVLQLSGANTLTNIFNGFASATALSGGGSADIENLSGSNTITSDMDITGAGGNGINFQSDPGAGNFLTLAGTLANLSSATYRVMDLGGNGNGLVSGPILAVSNSLAISKDGAGTWTLAANNGFNRSVALNGGTLQLGNGGTTGDAAGQSIGFGASGATLAFDRSDAPTFNDAVSLNGTNTIAVANGTTATLAGIISSTTNAALFINNGGNAGTLILGAADTYTNSTTVSAGTLLVNGSLAAASAVTVTGGAVLGGTGTVGGPVALSGTVAPGGGGVGTLSTGGETWNGGGHYLFGVSNATNSAGWDGLNIGGQLNVQATAGSPFVINVASLTAGGMPGLVPGFANGGNYLWTLAVAGGGIANFNPAKFSVDTAGFSNAFTGTFSVATNGNSLVLAYTPALAPLVSPVLAGGSLAGGTFAFSFSGANGQGYRVLASTNLQWPLTNWLVLTNGVFGTGTVNFIDGAATNGQEFYRVSSP